MQNKFDNITRDLYDKVNNLRSLLKLKKNQDGLIYWTNFTVDIANKYDYQTLLLLNKYLNLRVQYCDYEIMSCYFPPQTPYAYTKSIVNISSKEKYK